jgi:hypothetical protein
VVIWWMEVESKGIITESLLDPVSACIPQPPAEVKCVVN